MAHMLQAPLPGYYPTHIFQVAISQKSQKRKDTVQSNIVALAKSQEKAAPT